MNLWRHVQGCSHFLSYKTVERLCKSKITQLQMTIISNKNVLKFDVHVSGTSILMESLESMNQLFANCNQQTFVFHNQTWTLRFFKTSLILSFSKGTQKWKQVTIFAIIESQKIASLLLSIDYNWLFLLKADNINYIWMTSHNLSNLVLLLCTALTQLVNIRLEYFDTNLLLVNNFVI